MTQSIVASLIKKAYQSFVFSLLFLLVGCDLRHGEKYSKPVFGNEIKLVQVQPDQHQRLVASFTPGADSYSFQITYQQIGVTGETQAPQVLALEEIVDPSAVYRGLHPVSFGSMLFGFVLLVGQGDVGEMQGLLFVWNGTNWHYDAATRVLLNNLTAASDVDIRLEKVFPYNGLSSSIQLMTVQDLQSARQELGDVFFPEVKVSSQHGEQLLILAKVDTGSASVFLLDQSADELHVHRLPSPMDSAIPQTCKPLEAAVKKCGVNDITSLSIVYNCQGPAHNQGETEVNRFENNNNAWTLQRQSTCDQKSDTDK